MIRSLCLFLLLCFNSVYAINAVVGTFEATKSCPAYLSKNNKTNPEQRMVVPGQKYVLKEINKNPPDWFRIEITDPQNTLRWVNSHCGQADYSEINQEACDDNAGMADSHLLALSSQPGFCETYGYEAGKPECRELTGNSYQASHLTLHGLWPNQTNCGQRYGFCNAQPRASHCAYSPLNLSPTVAEQLKKLMPSYHYGSCLERHEWNKHGTCTVLSQDNYFTLAMRLATEADNSVFGRYLTENRGKMVKRAYLRELIAQSFGAHNANKIYFSCKNKKLVDVYIRLPALITFNEPLTTLINQATDYPTHDSCPANLFISNFNKETWR
jgi:ribonuclease T2